MKEKKITQKALSKMLGVSEVTLIRNFKGETQMRVDVLVEILQILEISLTFNYNNGYYFKCS